jgi:ECF transporter S component (folate family)
MTNKTTHSLVFTGLMVAIGIVLSQFLSVTLPNPSMPIIKFGLGYTTLILVSILLGPVWGFFAAITQDLLGFFLFAAAQGQIFHLGFTLNAILYGVVPGLLMYKSIKTNHKRFFWMNFGLMAVFLLLIGLYLFYPERVNSSTLGLEEKTILISVSFVATIGLIILNFYVNRLKKLDFNPHQILFVILLLYLIVSLILTPTWNYMLINSLPLFSVDFENLSAYVLYVIPLRIVKMPIEITAYVLLLTPLLTLLKRLFHHEDLVEPEIK